MIRNALRKELDTLLKTPAGSRAPAIRRSLREEWLYATDLPALYGGTVPDGIQKALDNAGWEYAPDGKWLQLRKSAKEPPENWFGGTFGPEAACCLSLVRRHPISGGILSDPTERMLIKAGEEGETSYEEACAVIHRAWAANLREGNNLPAISRRYFGE